MPENKDAKEDDEVIDEINKDVIENEKQANEEKQDKDIEEIVFD